VLLTVLDRSLRLLHPVMPFLTEELWHRLPGFEAVHPETIALAPYPEGRADWRDDAVEARMGALMEAVTRLRSLAAELGVRPGQGAAVHLWIDPEGDPALAAFLEEQRGVLRSLCPTGKTGSLEVSPAPEGASRDLVAGVNVGLVPEARELGAEERARLAGELEALEAEIGRARGRLANEQFLAKAPPEVVEGNRRRLAELEERRERLAAGLGGG
jgi:valyl-tRNA synthetase